MQSGVPPPPVNTEIKSLTNLPLSPAQIASPSNVSANDLPLPAHAQTNPLSWGSQIITPAQPTTTTTTAAERKQTSSPRSQQRWQQQQHQQWGQSKLHQANRGQEERFMRPAGRQHRCASERASRVTWLACAPPTAGLTSRMLGLSFGAAGLGSRLVEADAKSQLHGADLGRLLPRLPSFL